MTFEVTILGSNSALPAAGRHPTSQVLNVHDDLYLIDCGEGTQIQMNRYHVKRGKIDHIFISHLHGDHILGLLPLINSFSLNRRTRTLHIYGPEPIRRFIQHQLECTNSKLPYELYFHEFKDGHRGKIMENESLEVFAFPLDHRIPTLGYLFREKQQLPHILPEVMREQGVPFEKVPAIKKGASVQNAHGDWLPASQLTRPAAAPRSYAFMSDTRYSPSLSADVKGVDLLYHEATFLHELLDRAEKTRHTTAREAGLFATSAEAKKLLIGHFSTRYLDLTPLLEEAKNHFQQTLLATEGTIVEVPSKEN